MKYEPAHAAAYTNPVLKEQFPDPFILAYAGGYFAYSTGTADDGLAVPMARSMDLVNWEMIGGSLLPVEENPPFYWAPEVTYWNGTFYMYYSCGNEIFMEIRVATAPTPEGPFTDAGVRLTTEQFAIDPHVFIDQDGTKYLFYATDFLDHSHIGTGTVVDRMRSWFELEQKPVPVTRAAYDWQVYDPNRAEKGGVRWHTVEGPTVMRSKDRYIQMFSGGNWQNESYGVAYASSDSVDANGAEWGQEIDGSNSFPILRTVEGKVLGPGHNSIVKGPNGRELYCVYHSWIDGKRMMSLDRMDTVGTRVFVSGPTFDPQPLPFRPNLEKRGLTLEEKDISLPLLVHLAYPFSLFRIWFHAHSTDAALRLTLRSGDGEIRLVLSRNEISVKDSGGVRHFALPVEFDFSAAHELRVEIAEGLVLCALGVLPDTIDVRLSDPVVTVELDSTEAVRVPWLAVTYGFEDTFENERDLRGWRLTGDGSLQHRNHALLLTPGSDLVEVSKGPLFDDFELVASLRSSSGSFAIVFRDPSGAEILDVAVSGIDQDLSELLVKSSRGIDRSTHSINFRELRQIRILRIGTWLTVTSESETLGSFEVNATSCGFGIAPKQGPVDLDLVRWTSLAVPAGKEV